LSRAAGRTRTATSEERAKNREEDPKSVHRGAGIQRLIVRFTYSFVHFSAETIFDRIIRINRRAPLVQKQT
jgi:hypothetical protein